MKTINNYLCESVKSDDRHIVDMLNMFAKCSSGVQQALYKKKAEDAESVDIVPLANVFTEDEINNIKRIVRPWPKMCYENAWKLVDRFAYNSGHTITYVEGYLNMKGLPIEHAFNKVDGKYVDITVELALNKPIEDIYVQIGEFDDNEVRSILLQNGFYGQIYETIFLNKYKENVEK